MKRGTTFDGGIILNVKIRIRIILDPDQHRYQIGLTLTSSTVRLDPSTKQRILDIWSKAIPSTELRPASTRTSTCNTQISVWWMNFFLLQGRFYHTRKNTIKRQFSVIRKGCFRIHESSGIPITEQDSKTVSRQIRQKNVHQLSAPFPTSSIF